jgi:hypothetical protein
MATSPWSLAPKGFEVPLGSCLASGWPASDRYWTSTIRFRTEAYSNSILKPSYLCTSFKELQECLKVKIKAMEILFKNFLDFLVTLHAHFVLFSASFEFALFLIISD